MMDFAEKAQRCHEYVEALEQERRKIRVFQRELPLCLELVTQAIETCKNQLSATEFTHELSECSEQSSGDRPVLEEFIPIKSSSSPSSCDEEQPEKLSCDKQKSEWLRSVQLWNQNSDPVVEQKEAAEVKGNGGAFQPYEKEKSAVKSTNNCKTTPSVPAAATSSSAVTECGGEKEEKGKDGQRKQRRSWSPELHRRFLHALQQLGGSHTATPKQIRELMKVEGLTNDEVKSHLQKYRLHTRRPSSGIQNNSNQQPPQFLVVGGIWLPGEATGIVPAATNGVYAPIPMPLAQHISGHQQKQSEQLQSEERASQSGVVHSHSPSTSSSTHTTTTSHVF